MERPANMMPNGMAAQQHMNTMQRPQSGNPQQQLYAQILTNVKNKTSQLPAGWPTTFDPGQRAANIMQVVTALRMMGQDTMKCMQIAETFEERCINESNTKDIYQQRIQSKLQEIHTKRSQNPMVPQMQQGNMGMPVNMNGNMGMQQNMGNMGGMNMMQNNGMASMSNMGMNGPSQGANMSAGQNGSNQQNQSFPAQLQRPMQASPLPPQQQAPQPNGTLNPAALQNTQMPGQNGVMANANVQQSNAGQGQQGNVPHAQVVAMAKQLLASTPDDKKAQMRQQLMNGMDANRRQQVMASNSDPLVQYFMTQARAMLSRKLATQRDQQTAQNGGMQMGNGMGGASMQQTPSQSGGQNFDFGSILGQQADAIKLQESGEQVVPASNNGKNNNNNNNASYSATNGQGNVLQSQGVNPQGITSQNQPSSNVQYQQFLAMQQEKQRQQQQGRTQQQSQMAQNQAMMQQQAQQLRGQPGGLNAQNAFNGGQVNSPAMNMLNRPMQPPGQPSTPQPQANRQGMPPIPVSGANQIAQHHQTMLNQNQHQNNQHASAAQMSRRDQMINQLPPALRDKISGLPPQQLDMALARIFAQRNQNSNAPGNQQAMNMGNFQMSNQQQQNANMMQANMGSAVPNFNSQPQQQGQQAQADQTLQMQQRLQQHQQNQVRQRAMDFMPFPQNLLSTLGLAVPDGVDQWGSLKQHVNQTQAVLPQNTLAKLQSAQHQYFQQHPAEMQRAMQNLQQRMQQHAASQQGSAPQQTPSARPPSSMAMPNGQAPQAQMIPPNLSMQQQQQQQQQGQGVKGGNASQQPVRVPPPQLPTNQEIEMFKQKFPGARNLTDDQLRQMIYQKKVAAANEQAAQVQQQLAFQTQMQRAQAGNNNAGQMGNVPQGNQQQPPRPQQQQQAQAPKQASAQGAPQGQKRPQPSTDDVMEIPNPNPPSKAAVQASATQTNLSQQQQPQGGMRMPTQEELSKMSAPQQEMARHQMRQMEALRKAQASGRQQPPQPQAQAQAHMQAPQQQQQQQSVQQPTAQNAGSNVSGAETALRQKIAALYKEVNAAHPKGPAVQLDAKSKEQVQASLRKLWAPSVNLPQSFLVAIRHPQFGEQRVRETIRNIMIVQQNASDASGNARDFYSVTPADMRQIEAFYAKYFTDMKAVQQGQKNNVKQQNQQPATAVTTTTTTPQQPRPQQPSKQQQQTTQKPARPARKASAANTKAPPAPTDNKTFDWGSPSPHGVPKYQASGNELTMDKLKMPATKKRKTGTQSDHQVSSPAAQTATPKAADNKAQSQTQDTRTKTQAQSQQLKPSAPEPTKYKCDDVFCDASVSGFDTELQLKEHWEAEHKPVADPMKFLLESAAKALNVDQEGNPLATKKNAPGLSQPRAAAAAARPTVKKGPTPMSKQSSATPTPGAKALSMPAEKKPVDARQEAKKTLMGTMASKVGFDLPAKPAGEPTAPGVVEEDEDRAWIDNLQESLSDLKEFVDPWAHLARITNWDMGTELHSSPEPTPSDETSESSRESDISLNDRMRINFEWNAFGDTSTYVPEALRMDSLGLSESKKSEDLTTEDGNEGAKSDKQDKQKASDWDWNADAIDWDMWMDQ